MTYLELVEEIADRTGTSKTTVAKVLKSFMRESSIVLEAGETMTLPGFGTFYSVKQRPRKIFGGTRMSGQRRMVRFKESRHGKARRTARRHEDEDGR